MTRGLLFWILMILWLIFGIFINLEPIHAGNYYGMGGTLLQFILFGLLGWQVYGPAVK